MNEEMYIPMQDATELVGCLPRYFSRLAKHGIVKIKRVGKSRHVRWSDLKTVAETIDSPFRLMGQKMLELEKPPQDLLLSQKERSAKESSSFFVNRLEIGDCRDWMKKMPKFVQTVVTSPPYWGVRRYEGKQEIAWLDGTKVAFGLEKKPEDYVRHTLEILRQIKTVLRNDGIVWWNIGDTYLTRAVIRKSTVERLDAYEGRRYDKWSDYPVRRYSSGHRYLKDKDLTLIPFQIAIGAQHLGFWVRSVIVWAKENQMPEPIKDRPTSSHEYIIMLTKSRHYYYNKEAAQEPAVTEAVVRENGKTTTSDLRNLRTVWSFSVDCNNIHTAAFPVELPTRCILASTKPGELVFDPFLGSGTTAVAADRHSRTFFGCDICEDYVIDAKNRLEIDRLDRKSLSDKEKQAKLIKF